LAYSTDGITWTANGSAIFTTSCNGVAWSGQRWVACGQGTGGVQNTLAYSADGITWTGIGSAVFTTAGNGVAWNGQRFVAVGQGGVSIAYSTDGISWTGVTLPAVSTTIFTSGTGVCWNGQRFVATGSGGSSIAESGDGITWTALGASSTAIFSTQDNGCAGNPRIGAVLVDSQLVLNTSGAGLQNKLDVVADGYYNNGFTNFSMTIRSRGTV